jgi:hypothetical protein
MIGFLLLGEEKGKIFSNYFYDSILSYFINKDEIDIMLCENYLILQEPSESSVNYNNCPHKIDVCLFLSIKKDKISNQDKKMLRKYHSSPLLIINIEGRFIKIDGITNKIYEIIGVQTSTGIKNSIQKIMIENR